MTLTEFLLSRIAEDEADARKAMTGFPTGTWSRDGGSIHAGHETREVVDWVYGEAWDHIARHDPARVLAECEAKRRIAELHQIEGRAASVWHDRDDGLRQLVSATEYTCRICGWVGEDSLDDPGTTLRALALPYADHPDYRQEWRP